MHPWRPLILILLLASMLPIRSLASDGYFACPQGHHSDVPTHHDCGDHREDGGASGESITHHCTCCLLGISTLPADLQTPVMPPDPDFLPIVSILPAQPYFELLRPPRG